MIGEIKWYNSQKGYGFITGDDNKEYFLHRTAFPEGTKLMEGDKVTFEPVEAERGVQAKIQARCPDCSKKRKK